MSRSSGDTRADQNRSGKAKWLIVAALVILALILFFFLFDVDAALQGGNVDVDAPDVNADVQAPDVDADVDVDRATE